MKVPKRLEEKDLLLKPEKCVFNTKEVEYLSFLIKPKEISMNPTKLAGIRDCIPLTNVKGVRSFLGFGNFYRRFIGNYVEISKPLNDSTLPSPGYSMWNPWKGDGLQKFQMDSILLVDGFHGMGDGFHTSSRWIPYLFQLDSILFPYGIQLE